MAITHIEFDAIQELLDRQGIDATLEKVADELHSQEQWHHLFEIRKMQARRRAGLPLLYGDSGDNLDESQRTKLEDGLLQACREIGTQLLKAGRIREGWIYFRPVGDRPAVNRLMEDIEATEENLDELIEVLLHEGVDVARGYKLVLEQYGTCNSITTFESAMHRHGKDDQQAAARLLVRHVHHELSESLRADIARQEGSPPPEADSLQALVADRAGLFGELTYHIDTTHLASTVRIARMLDDPESLELALDLTHYGRRLSEKFQYEGDEPFADLYPSHALYFEALLGRNVEAALDYFHRKAGQLDVQHYGTVAIEIYVDLLHRVGRDKEAIDTALRLMPEDMQPRGLAPSLLELSEAADDFQQLLEFCRERNDLLGFTTSLVRARERQNGG